MYVLRDVTTYTSKKKALSPSAAVCIFDAFGSHFEVLLSMNVVKFLGTHSQTLITYGLYEKEKSK